MEVAESRLRMLLAEKIRRRKQEKIRYWSPNGGQDKWLQEIFRDKAFVVVNGSGNGGGKTYGIIAFLAAVCFPLLAPKSLQNPLVMSWPYPKRARIVSTHTECEEIGSIQATIKELFPAGRYTAVKNGKKFNCQFTTDTGWVIDVMTYDQDEGDFAGPSIGLIIFNEPMPEPIWRECLARTRKGGLVLVAMTSLLDHPWVVDGILNKADGKDIRVLYCDQEENCKQHGTNGSLDHDTLIRILNQYPEDEREARKTGKPLSLSGRIFKGFDRLTHVSKVPIQPPSEGVAHYMICDPAIGKPLFVIWAYVDKAGSVKIYKEYPFIEFHNARDSNLTVKEYANIFKSVEAGYGIKEVTRILDRHFGNVRRTLGGATLKEEFATEAIYFGDSYALAEGVPEVEAGILKVKEYLHYDKTKPVGPLNFPRLEIGNDCPNTIASLERWGRDPETGKPTDDYKDGADCVRYLVCANPEVPVERIWRKRANPYYGVGAKFGTPYSDNAYA